MDRNRPLQFQRRDRGWRESACHTHCGQRGQSLRHDCKRRSYRQNVQNRLRHRVQADTRVRSLAGERAPSLHRRRRRGRSELGTTVSGGLTGKTCRTGCGTVFKLTPASGHWQESVLHRFTGGAGGAVPYAGVTMDSAGNLYGATLDGGAAGGGAVYRLTPGSAGWEQSVLYSFQGRPDGSAPYPTPVLDAAGNLYGTTNAGGAHNLGIVYMLAPQSDGTWTEHVLHTFAGGADGANPLAGVILDRRGNLYGTTSYGGTANCGIAFALAPNQAGGWAEHLLH